MYCTVLSAHSYGCYVRKSPPHYRQEFKSRHPGHIQIGNDHIGQGLAECAEAIQPTFLPLDSAKFVVQGVFRQFRAIILGVKPDTDGFHSPASGLYDRVIPPRLSFNGLGCFGS